ncbi:MULTISPECIES: adenylyltransferase/cytidyltransferase family protein [unclassified Bradyrhizobium]|uniref:adenylyltransferase/cytidyltransferase family protein n=1 Tax=Bradyrhizobium TaxID=374 RepID=UPI0028E84124|nr:MULTISPECIES: adenylyltransferase/cytidyltransferase family protein [unclassified Bradyrhizobium]
MTHYGLVLGRFQPLHIGHMEYLEAAKRSCDRLVVGITNPDTSSLIHHQADPNRSKNENNPFSYFLRYEMVDQSLRDAGWPPDSFAIVPADVADLSKVTAFLPTATRTTVFITIYDAWGEEKARRLEDLGYKVEILWRRSMSQRVTSGTELRRLMQENRPWRQFVPPGVALHIDRSGWLPSS